MLFHLIYGLLGAIYCISSGNNVPPNTACIAIVLPISNQNREAPLSLAEESQFS